MAQAETQVPGPAQDSSRTKKLNTAIEEIEPQRVIIDTDLGSSVDENGVTTFTADSSSNRCYQVASNMNATAAIDRFREIFRLGNPSITMLKSGEL